MNIVKNKLDDSEKIIKLFDEYFDKLKPLIEEKYPTETKILSNIIAQYPKQSEKINLSLNVLDTIVNSKKLLFESFITAIFDLYGNIQDFYLSMENMRNFFSQPHFRTENIEESDLSQTYRLEAADFLGKLLLQYNNFIKKHKENDAAIVEYLTELINTTIIKEYSIDEKNMTTPKDSQLEQDVLEAVKYIQSRFYANKNTVSLYASFIQEFINYLYGNGPRSKKIMFQIVDLIEADKDFFISGNVREGKSASAVYKSNPALKRFGLIPVTDSMPIDKLIPIITDKKTTGKINLKSYAKMEGVCFILINKVVYTPVEYNVKPLFIKQLAADLIQPESYGVTEKVVERYKTITMLDPQKWDYSYEIVGEYKNPKIDIFYILETLDSENYRALAPWIYAVNLGIQRYRIKGFLDYITNPGRSTRISNYQAVSIKKALPNMFLRRPLNLDIMEEQSKDIDTQIIRNELFLKITGVIRDLIRKEYANGKKILSNLDINEIIHDQRIQDIFANTLLNLYKVGAKMTSVQEFEAGKFPFYELLSSYLLELNKILARFMKELHDSYNRSLLDESVFKQDDYTKSNSIIQKLEKIVIDVLQSLVSDKENIYTELNYKYLLLNFY